ncbi:MAG: hypothetical protein KUG78_20530, partial [Kangiellaceae bacterium]|nr:hypothetical protein [Kangiellaceae bacterium]
MHSLISKTVLIISFLLLFNFTTDVHAICNGIEPDCTIEELDQIRPESIRYHALIDIGGYGTLDEEVNDDPSDLSVCSFLDDAPNPPFLFKDCEYLEELKFSAEQCHSVLGDGTCQNEINWGPYEVVVSEIKECGGLYPYHDLQDINICHMSRQDRHCPKTIDNPICIGTLAKKQRFDLYQGKGANRLSYSIYYDSLYANSWITPSLARHSVATATYLKQVNGLSENLRIDLPNNLRFHFYKYGTTWKADNSSAGKFDGNTYITKSGKKYLFSSLPTVHRQVTAANSTISSSGSQLDYSFDEAQQQTIISDQFGRSLTLQYDINSQLQNLTDPAGQTTNLTYDAQNRLIRITYPDNKFIELVYENLDYPNYLTGMVNENADRISTYSYNESGEAISTARSDGLITVINKDEQGVVTVDRYDGTDAIYSQEYQLESFNERYQISQIKTKACPTCPEKIEDFEINSDGLVTAKTNEHGVRDEYTRDSYGDITYKKLAVGKAEQVEVSIIYNSTHRKPSFVGEHDGRTYYSFNADGLVTQKRAGGYVASDYILRYQNYEYDANNLLTKYNGERTNVSDETTFTYDVSGNLSTITNALNQITHFRNYDAHGNAQQIEDSNGLITNLVYNSRQWLMSIDSGGRLTTFAYDHVGNVSRVTSPSGIFVDYEYDLENRVVELTDTNSNKIEYSYDGSGNATQTIIKDDLNQIQTIQTSTFNSLELLNKSEGNSGQKYEVEYDVSGNPIEEKNGLNDITTNQFDYFNRLNKSIDPLNGETSRTFDKNGRIDSITDAEGKTTEYTYNFFDELTKLDSPDTGITTFTYDKAGNVLTKKDAHNETVTYTYDALNRVLTQSYSDVSENIVYTYDDTTNGNKGIGRLTSVTDESGSTSYFYNAFGQVTKETRVIDGNSYVTEYLFDANGQMTGTIYPSGREITYTFDGLARVSGLTSTTQSQGE